VASEGRPRRTPRVTTRVSVADIDQVGERHSQHHRIAAGRRLRAVGWWRFVFFRDRLVDAPPYLNLLLFVGIAVATLTASIVLTPPDQVPDVVLHFDRAVEVSQGGLVGTVRDGGSGDFLSPGVRAFQQVFQSLPSKAQNRVTAADFRRAGEITWGNTRQFVQFSPTTERPPVAYFPGALAVLVARSISNRILVAYYAVEVSNAVVFVALVAWAMLLFRGIASSLLAAVALLPMTISLAGSPSTDGIIIGLVALYAGVLYRLASDGGTEGKQTASHSRGGWLTLIHKWSWLDYVAFCALAIVVLAKPPYFPLVAAFGLARGEMRSLKSYLQRLVAPSLLLVLLAGSWYLVGARFQATESWVPPGVSISGQIRFVLTNPARALHVAAHTLRVVNSFYWTSFVGILGWLDTLLQPWVYAAAGYGLGALFVIGLITGRTRLAPLICCLIATLASAVLIFATLYADWTPVGAPVVQGVQGRYFLPLVPVLILGLGENRARVMWGRAWGPLSIAIWLGLAFACLVASSTTLLGRYWLT